MTSVLSALMSTIEERRQNPSEGSYTCFLMQQGLEAIAEKISEEVQEVIEAARESAEGNQEHLIHEMADTFYHLCVLLGYCQVPWSAIEQELARRFGTSGLEEKASRRP
jgi:phosphoribosyl-ATP pyrophosphohydrolase